MREVIALAVSYLFVFSVIGAASMMLATGRISPFITRKLVHIGVSNWWILAMLLFQSRAVALIGPISFIIINYISYRKHIFAAMEHEIPHNNLGTIYFPVSLTIMVLLTFEGPMPMTAGAGAILVLGYGDGLAAIIGNALSEKSRTIPLISRKKTVAGSTAMFAASAAVLCLIQALAGGGLETADLLPIALISAAAALVEAVTPYGLDNISIPLAVGLLSWRFL